MQQSKNLSLSYGFKWDLNLNVLEYYLFTIIIIILHCDCTLLHFCTPFLWIACLIEMEVASRPVDERTRGELQFFSSDLVKWENEMGTSSSGLTAEVVGMAG